MCSPSNTVVSVLTAAPARTPSLAQFGVPLKSTKMAKSLKEDGETAMSDVLVQVSDSPSAKYLTL